MAIDEQRGCPTCGEQRATPVLEPRDPGNQMSRYRVVRCAACGLCFTRPLPDEAEYTALYNEAYYLGQQARLIGGELLRGVLDESIVAGRLGLLRRPPGRALDVGCGPGLYLDRLRRRGWQVEGTDRSPAAVRLTRRRGLTVHHGPLAELDLPSDSFDLVTLWHVLEHLEDPLGDLLTIRRLLRPGGELMLEVPNFASVTSRWAGASWFSLQVPVHLQHFSPASLDRLLHRAGFRPVRRKRANHGDIVSVLYTLFAKLDLQPAPGPSWLGLDRPSPLPEKVAFLTAWLACSAVALPWFLATRLWTGQGETLTFVCRAS